MLLYLLYLLYLCLKSKKEFSMNDIKKLGFTMLDDLAAVMAVAGIHLVNWGEPANGR